MKYDFDTIHDRKNTGSIKYDFSRKRARSKELLPMWVADMDFQLPPEVLKDIHETVSHGIFGYTEPTGAYYDAVTGWFQDRFGYTAAREEIVPSPGVVFSLAQAIRAFTAEGESVIIQTPVYYPFFHVIRDNERKIAANPLVCDGGRYSMDFEGFERLAAQTETKLFILCSPHNPVGRVWTREELARICEICKRHGVLVVSDEIHCDFVWRGSEHTCYGLLDEDAVVCAAPSKTFNLAGLQVSNLFIKNARLRRGLKAEIGRTGYSQLNTAGLAACKSAYQNGGPWLTQLKEYLQENIAYTRNFLRERLPKIKLTEPEGTYLLWLDFSAYGLPQSELDRRVTEGAGLWLDGGTMFGAGGEGFQRINIACPRSILGQAMEQLENEF
jgi:cystathionine beta-lyase